MLLSGYTQLVLGTLGQQIKAARLESRMSQAELGERIGVSRYTIRAIETGSPEVSVGTVLEAAVILGLPLMQDDPRQVTKVSQALAALITLLPERGQQRPVQLDDNF